MTPLEENVAVNRHAAACGLEYVRSYRKLRVTDPAALKAAGLMVAKPKPDYARIVELLDSGASIAGVEVDGVEYVLRPRA